MRRIVEHPKELREQASQFFEQGDGYKLVATKLGISMNTTKEWHTTWRTNGSREFCKIKSGDNCEYPLRIKLLAVCDYLSGDNAVDVMERCGIRDRKLLKRWTANYSEIASRNNG